MPYVFEDVFAS